MIPLVSQLLQQDSELGMIIQTLFSLAFIVYIFYAQRLQTLQMLRQVEVTLRKVKSIRDEGRETAIKTINELGRPGKDISAEVDRFMDHFVISPIDMDPAGVVGKLKQILDTREDVWEYEVKNVAPNASENERNNIENLLEVSMALNIYYKVVRHYYLLGKKTMNIYIIMQIHMVLPLLMMEIEAYASALQAFQEGMPIGDSVGAIVAGKLMHGYPNKEVAKEMVAAEVPFEGRTLIVMKARGPGGSVGEPGEAIKNVLDKKKGKVKIIITVDAAGKLEGEAVGSVAEGVGAAIGGPGVDKYQMEETAKKYNVPLHAVAIKEGIEHVVSPLVDPLFDGVDKAVEAVKRIVLNYTQEGDTVLIAGIGNTVGVAQ